jgi:hypothetical protein
LQKRAPDRYKAAVPFFEGLDAALARIGFTIDHLAGFRVLQSGDSELVMHKALDLAGNPAGAEFLMRRHFALEPGAEAIDQKEMGLIARLIQSACEGVEVLERLERQYPETVAREAQYVDRWPVLRRRNDPAVRASQAGTTLGKRYPLESEGIVHGTRKNSLRMYLKPVVEWLVRNSCVEGSLEERRLRASSAIKSRGIPFHLPFGPCPEEAVGVLVAASELPPLRKSTARQWAEKLVVPFIMATDAADVTQLDEPALLGIWNQRRVKSRKGFQSRLLDAVRKELPRMACR